MGSAQSSPGPRCEDPQVWRRVSHERPAPSSSSAFAETEDQRGRRRGRPPSPCIIFIITVTMCWSLASRPCGQRRPPGRSSAGPGPGPAPAPACTLARTASRKFHVSQSAGLRVAGSLGVCVAGGKQVRAPGLAPTERW